MYAFSLVPGTVGTHTPTYVWQEDPKQTLYFAHLFFADHMLSTAWLVFFAVVWWVYTPHDGRVQANSAAQKEVMESGQGHNMTEEERVAAAMSIWNTEKGLATAMLVIGWLLKVCLFSCRCSVPRSDLAS